MSDSERDDLLAKLNVYGKQFLDSFQLPPEVRGEIARKKRKMMHTADEDDQEESFPQSDDRVDDGWGGFSASSSDSETEEEDNDQDGAESDRCRQPEIVVFASPSNSQAVKPTANKLLKKHFMSSKISKLREDIAECSVKEDESGEDLDNDLERTNVQNDALLHKLVHTRLLSGSLKDDLNFTRGQRQKALQGRLLELAAEAKLGKGGSLVRKDERLSASKRVRLGLERKIKERNARSLEEAKNLGNYHQSIKHVFDADGDKPTKVKKREHGLRLGVGKFSSGMLKLSKQEIASVQGNGLSQKGRAAAKGTKRRK